MLLLECCFLSVVHVEKKTGHEASSCQKIISLSRFLGATAKLVFIGMLSHVDAGTAGTELPGARDVTALADVSAHWKPWSTNRPTQ